MGQLKKLKAIGVAKNSRRKRHYTPMQMRAKMIAATLDREHRDEQIRNRWRRSTGSLVSIPPTSWDLQCPSCQCFYPVLTKHHIKPKSCGGSGHFTNLISICWECHKVVHQELNEHGQDALKKMDDAFFHSALKVVMEQRRLQYLQI